MDSRRGKGKAEKEKLGKKNTAKEKNTEVFFAQNFPLVVTIKIAYSIFCRDVFESFKVKCGLFFFAKL